MGKDEKRNIFFTSGGLSFDAIFKKLAILADAAKYDASCASSGSKRKRPSGGMGNAEGMGICHSFTPDGRCVSLLKILLTNFCIYDCKYCVNRISSDTPRARFTPKEVVQLTLEFYRRNYIEGLFLSSGIVGSSDETMLQLIEVARSLREDHRFGGYIHLKVVAGSSEELIAKAGRWADRISANIEMPLQADLDLFAPAKRMSETTASMSQIKSKIDESKDLQKKFKKAPKFSPGGQSTQMVVGASSASDKTILESSQNLYHSYGLRRVYYSAYSPVPQAHVLLPKDQPPLKRENRLYQADWLLRFYGFQASELTTESDPNLSLEYDPKTQWALRNKGFFPVDINTAPREHLLRVPGLGVRNVDRIISLRRYLKIKFADLVKMRVAMGRAKFFLTTFDYNPDALLIDSLKIDKKIKISSEQLSLFSMLPSEKSGEL